MDRAAHPRTWLDGPWYWAAVGVAVGLLLLVAAMACAASGTTLPAALVGGYVLFWQVATSDAGAALFLLVVLVALGVGAWRKRAARPHGA